MMTWLVVVTSFGGGGPASVVIVLPHLNTINFLQ